MILGFSRDGLEAEGIPKGVATTECPCERKTAPGDGSSAGEQATTKVCVSIARARARSSKCAGPTTSLKAAGYTIRRVGSAAGLAPVQGLGFRV